MKFGLVLPSIATGLEGTASSEVLNAFIERGERGPFDSLWVLDHLLVPKTGYSVSWLDPLSVLNYAAARTDRVRLGTSVIVLPLRNPVLLAKALCSLDFVSDHRLTVGLGAGWYKEEFRACGIPMRERGARTTEAAHLLRRLLSEEEVTFQGRFYSVQDVTIHPRPPECPPMWMGGGSSNGSKMPEAVAERIASSDGWIIRPLISPEVIEADWQKIVKASEGLGRDPGDLEISMVNYLHVSALEGERGIDEQKRMFQQLMGTKRSWEYAQRHYLTGHLEEMTKKLDVLEAAGVRRMMLHPITLEPRQLELWADLLSGMAP